MATEVVVPPIGESITSVVLLSWDKNVGDSVRMGDVLGELETDKSSVPLECPANGEILVILVEEGATVEIGTPLVVVGKAGESWTPRQSQEEPKTSAEGSPPGAIGRPTKAAGNAAPAVETTPSDNPHVKAAPSARRLAKERGIDIAAVSAGIGGKRVTESHVRAFAASETNGVQGRPVKLSRIQRVVAERMTQSAQMIPQFSVSILVDASALMRARDASGSEDSRISLTAYLVAAAAGALLEHPAVHARHKDAGSIYAFGECNIGVAVDTQDGLVAPVLRNVEGQTPAELSVQLERLVKMARDGALGPDEQASATFTISNLGPLGALRFTPMVVPGQGAILGVGAVQEVPVASVDGALRWRPVFEATLTADHRVTDGAEATRFLTTFKNGVESLK